MIIMTWHKKRLSATCCCDECHDAVIECGGQTISDFEQTLFWNGWALKSDGTHLCDRCIRQNKRKPIRVADAARA